MKINRSISDKNNPTAVEVLSAVTKSYCRVNGVKKAVQTHYQTSLIQGINKMRTYA
ncbi:MAG: hypothetical protein AAGJ08_09105 [Cyanobacteria bacterium P01_H01_bin.35]